MAVLIIGREFAVSGLRSIAAAEGYMIKAGELGKSKMVAQVAAISLVLLSIDFPIYETAARVCLWGAMAFALASAAQYFRQFWRKVDEGVNFWITVAQRTQTRCPPLPDGRGSVSRSEPRPSGSGGYWRSPRSK